MSLLIKIDKERLTTLPICVTIISCTLYHKRKNTAILFCTHFLVKNFDFVYFCVMAYHPSLNFYFFEVSYGIF